MIDPINIQLRHRTGNVPYGRPRNAPSHPHRLVDAARTTWKGDFFCVRPLFVEWEE